MANEFKDVIHVFDLEANFTAERIKKGMKGFTSDTNKLDGEIKILVFTFLLQTQMMLYLLPHHKPLSGLRFLMEARFIMILLLLILI